MDLCPPVEEGVRRQLYRLRKGEGSLEEVSLVLCLGEGMKECKYGKDCKLVKVVEMQRSERRSGTLGWRKKRGPEPQRAGMRR